jgi:RHS repeat-associated protein
MNRLRSACAGAAGLAISVVSTGPASAANKDLLVQPPTIAQPQRGSIAGSLSRLAFGPATLARGTYSLPLPIDAPSDRGPLLASVTPAYSAESGVSEWGVGWQFDLSIRRHRVIGEIDFTDDDGFASPWGQLVLGDDGAYYPAGLRSMVRVEQTAGGGFRATTSDGTKFAFDAADAETTSSGTYAWNLSSVTTLLGDSTTLTWTRNATGRPFLSEVRWGGRFDGTQYKMSLSYEALPTPFATFVSGSKRLLDQRVKKVAVSVSNAGGYVERWHHDLAYQTSPTGPAFYLASITKTFASGSSEPPATYEYDFSTDQLASATFEAEPSLDAVLAAYGSGAIQPDKAAMTDMERNGLMDLEVQLDQTLVRQTEGGYVFEPLPALTGAENPLCRQPASATNKPRVLARMHGDADEPNVVVTAPNSTGTQTRVVVCDRDGFTQFDQWMAGAWALGANTRLADLDLDHKPDIVRVSYGSARVLRNTSTSPTQHAFAAGATTTLSPKVTPVASWIVDMNGDGRADLMVRHSGGVVVWRGTGGGSFEPTGTSYTFTTASGQPLSGLATYEFSHGDFNNDGLSDLILTKGQTVLLFTNRGDSFVQTQVAAFASIPWTVSFPVVADLSGSGNEQIVMADGAHAKTLQLSRPSTGLLVSADDGKGSVITFDYGRVRPAPGVNQLYSILASMQVDSSGYDAVTYEYDYGAPVWHSVGKYLVGFEDAEKVSPFLHETVAFHNDDEIAGVITSTLDEDDRTPGLARFSTRELVPATFHGVPWLRVVSEQSGWQTADGSASVTKEARYLAYSSGGLCPTVVETTASNGVHREESTLAQVPALDPELSCLVASRRSIGTHADPALDYDYRVDLQRDALGRVTQAVQQGPSGPTTLQQVTYDAQNRVATIATPGHGVASFAYDAVTGQPSSVTKPDGVVQTVVARDPVTDAQLASITNRAGAVWTQYASYDGLERLKSSWDDLSGGSPVLPLHRIDYVFPTDDAPGRIVERRLVDAAAGSTAESADIMAADGAVVTKAVLGPEGYAFSRVAQSLRNTQEQRSLVRDPLASLNGLTNASLLAGATLLDVVTKTGSGSELSASTTVATGVTGNRAVTRAIVDGHLVTTQTENGAYVTRTGSDADGKARWFQDQSGATTTYDYDAMGRLRRVHTPSGAHSLDYDAYGRTASVVREGVQRVEWSYDHATGLMTERRELTPSGQLDRATEYAYDAVGRIASTTESKPSFGEKRGVATLWDGTVPGGPSVPGQLGFSSGVQTDELSKQTVRTADGKVSSMRWNLDGWRIIEQELEYYANGEVKSDGLRVLDGDGNVLHTTIKKYGYDAYGRLVTCDIDDVELFAMTYDAQGRTASIQLSDGSVFLSYDPTTRAKDGYSMTGTVNGSVARQRNARGLTAGETFQVGGSTVQRSYGYDARGYLVSSSDPAGSSQYAYDASGLISAASDARGNRPIARSAGTITAGSETYAVDAMGRVVAHGDLTVEYGPTGDIERASRGADEFRFAYDEAGQRVLKYKNGAPVAAFVNGAYLTEDTLVAPVHVAGVNLGVLVDGEFQRLAFDERGSVITDDQGNIALPSPYGTRLAHGALAEAIDYAAKGYDRDLGLVRMGVRDYDPLLGQFWTPDPLYLTEIDKCAASPAQCNLYGYAANNPVSHVDPTGTESEKPRSVGATSGDVAYTAIDKVAAVRDFEAGWYGHGNLDQADQLQIWNWIFGKYYTFAPAPADVRTRVVAFLEGLELHNADGAKAPGLSSGQKIDSDGLVIQLTYDLLSRGPTVDGSSTSAKQSVNSVSDTKTTAVEASGGGNVAVADGGVSTGATWGVKGTEQRAIQETQMKQGTSTMNYKHGLRTETVAMKLTVTVRGRDPISFHVLSVDSENPLLHTVQRARAPGQR